MSIVLSVIDEESAEEDIQNLTMELFRTLQTETDTEPDLMESETLPGSKGVLAVVGKILLALTPKGVDVFADVIKQYFERQPSLEVELKREDGKSIRIKAENVKIENIKQTVAMAKEFMEG